MNQLRSQGKFSYFFGHETVSWITKSFRIWSFMKTVISIFQKYLHRNWKNFERLSEKFSLGCLWAHNLFIQWQVANLSKWLKTFFGEPRLWTSIGTKKMTNLDFNLRFFLFKSKSNDFLTSETFLKFGIH